MSRFAKESSLLAKINKTSIYRRNSIVISTHFKSGNYLHTNGHLCVKWGIELKFMLNFISVHCLLASAWRLKKYSHSSIQTLIFITLVRLKNIPKYKVLKLYALYTIMLPSSQPSNLLRAGVIFWNVSNV